MHGKRKKNTKIALKVEGHKLATTSNVHHGAYSYQVTSISDKKFSRFCADGQTDRQTDATKNNTCSQHAYDDVNREKDANEHVSMR